MVGNVFMLILDDRYQTVKITDNVVYKSALHPQGLANLATSINETKTLTNIHVEDDYD